MYVFMSLPVVMISTFYTTIVCRHFQIQCFKRTSKPLLSRYTLTLMPKVRYEQASLRIFLVRLGPDLVLIHGNVFYCIVDDH